MRNLLAAFRPTAPKGLGGPKKFHPQQATPKGDGFHLEGVEYEKHLDVIVNRLAETPAAVDMLAFIAGKILENPKEQKFRQVNFTNRMFIKTIGKSEEWGVRFLKAIGFTPNNVGDSYVLRKAQLRTDKITVAKRKLSNAQISQVYQLSKDRIAFSSETDVLLEDLSSPENLAKEEYLSKIPLAPKEGAAGSTKIRAYFGHGDIQRMFASDDTLESVLNWLAASFHTKIIEKLESGEYELIDRTTYPPKKIEVLKSNNLQKQESVGNGEIDLLGMLEDITLHTKMETQTLQKLELWPSGEVEIQKAGFLDRERALNGGPQVDSV